MKVVINTIVATIAFALIPITVVLAVDSVHYLTRADNPNKAAAAAK